MPRPTSLRPKTARRPPVATPRRADTRGAVRDRIRRAVLGVALIISLSTCQRDDGNDDLDARHSGTTFSVSAPGTDPASPVPTKVPKRAQIEIRSSATVEGVGEIRQSDLPSLRITLGFDDGAAPVGEDGAVGIRIEEVALADDATMGERETILLRDLATQDVTFLRGTFLVERPERSASVEMPIPKTASAPIAELLRQVEQAIAIVTVPAPPTPLGDGATWTATRSIRLAGVSWEQAFECTAARIQGGSPFGVSVRSKLFGAPQAYVMDGLPPGARAEILDARAEIKGLWTGTPGAPLPDQARLEVKIELWLRVHHEGAPSEVRVTHQSSLRFAVRE